MLRFSQISDALTVVDTLSDSSLLEMFKLLITGLLFEL